VLAEKDFGSVELLASSKESNYKVLVVLVAVVFGVTEVEVEL